MKKVLDLITSELEVAFEQGGYEKQFAKVTISNRPDLCEFQCNGAMVAAKAYKKAPIMIANDVVSQLQNSSCISKIEAVNPGFINISIHPDFLANYLNDMHHEEHLGIEMVKNKKTIMIDYGGPNVAKPLHVGHLRSAIIGESIKRIGRFMGHEMIGDVHLGDWGLQLGLIIIELKNRNPELVYFDANFTGEYPKEPPFTISELEEIYPTASARAKEDASYKEDAMQATYLLQHGHKGYQAILQHILQVSVTDLKKNYEKLHVTFDLWKGESDAQPYIPEMVEYLKANGYARMDDGALVIDVKEESDTKEIPPCMILKSDGASLYGTTDLATLVERQKLYHPNQVIYVVDKRQELHFVQVFRSARKAKIVNDETKLQFLGFGTMNGKDGKPFKTREGGVMRLEHFIKDTTDEMYKKIMDNRTVPEDEARKTAEIVGIAAIKYGDLSNQAAKDYVFDVDRFTSFEGNTGPYILYTIVRIKSILNKYKENGNKIESTNIMAACSDCEKSLMLEITKFNSVIEMAFEELAPHKICAYVYDLSNTLNRFYHETKILAEEDETRKESYIALLSLTKDILEACIDMLGFSAPERM
ncbi:arginine--tRNA ligase [Lachnospiraceae bacterium LCP25S3_G4]